MTRPDTVIKIGQAAEILGVHVNTLRNWEQEGKIKPKMRFQGTGTRYYDRVEIERLAALQSIPNPEPMGDTREGNWVGIGVIARRYDVSIDVIQALALDVDLFGPTAFFKQHIDHNNDKIREAIADFRRSMSF